MIVGEHAERGSQCPAGACFFPCLISQFTYSKAEDLVYSVMDFPELFRYPVCLTEEGCQHECTQDP